MLHQVFFPLFLGLATVRGQLDGDCIDKRGSPLPAVSSAVGPSLIAIKSTNIKNDKIFVDEEDPPANPKTWFHHLSKQHAASSNQRATARGEAGHMLDAVKHFESMILAQIGGESGTEETTDGKNATKHANTTAKLNKTLNETLYNENRTACRSCAQAELALITSLETARDSHAQAEVAALALADVAHKHEAAAADFSQIHKEFERLKKELSEISVSHLSPTQDFDDIVELATKLRSTAALAAQAAADKKSNETLEESSQATYHTAAAAAKLADEDVTAKKTAEEPACASMGLSKSTGPPTGTDLGYNHPVAFSSYAGYGPKESISDGITDETKGQHRQTGNLPHTDAIRDSWVEVDFGKMYSMGKVTIWNGWQWGCCQSRINPFRIVFFDASHNEVSRKTGLTAKTSGDGETPVVLDPPVTAQIVRVQLDGHSSYLHIAELRAYAA